MATLRDPPDRGLIDHGGSLKVPFDLTSHGGSLKVTFDLTPMVAASKFSFDLTDHFDIGPLDSLPYLG